MRPVSDAFLAAVRGSHQMTARARICTTFQTGTDPAGTEIPILGGDVQLDGTADIRSTVDLTTDATLWPTSSNTLLTPYGNEVFVERGVVLASGVEWVGLGYFRIEEPGQDDAPNGPVRLSGSDRMAGIVDARLLAPVQYLTGASLGTIMDDLITAVYPSATIEWDDSTDTAVLARSVIVEEDRFEFLNDLVRSRGKIWYWDHRGILVIKSVPSTTTPVFTVDEGPTGVLVNLSRKLSRKGVYNAVVASGEGTDTGSPVKGVKFDNNPDSPTYFSGPFGPVPRFYSSPMITTVTQARDAAEAILRKGLGLPYTVDFTLVPNPALEPYDPVSLRYSAAPTETHVLETVSVPLVYSGAMPATTREQTTVIIGTG